MQNISIPELLKCRGFDFTKLLKQEVSTLSAECNFTDEEEKIFSYRVKGISIIQIADKLHVSTRTVDRKINNIRGKIEKWSKIS